MIVALEVIEVNISTVIVDIVVFVIDGLDHFTVVLLEFGETEVMTVIDIEDIGIDMGIPNITVIEHEFFQKYYVWNIIKKK